MSDTEGTHLNRTLIEHVLYPPHPPRRPTKRFLTSRYRLIVELDLPCLVCGVRNSTLGDPTQNPYGATAMEAHHRLIEDSLANAIDVDKFNAKVLPALLRKTGDTATYGHPFTRAEMLDWIHGDAENLWILCSQHHRGKFVGIHSITGPIWGVQDLLIDGYNLTGLVAHSPEEAAQLTALPATTGEAEPPGPSPA